MPLKSADIKSMAERYATVSLGKKADALAEYDCSTPVSGGGMDVALRLTNDPRATSASARK